MKFSFDKFKNPKINIKEAVWFLGKHAFVVILFFIFIFLFLGALIFYKYVFLATKEKSEITEDIIKFDYKTYQNVMTELQVREGDNKENLKINE